MTLTLKTLGAALITAGLMASAQAAPVALSAVIDFDGLTPATSPPLSIAPAPSAAGSVGDTVTTQYENFGLVFTDNNQVRCSQATNADCTAPRLINPPPHAASSPNFLMNKVSGAGFSINVLNGFSLSSLRLDITANPESFFVKFFDSRNKLLSSPVEWATGGSFSRWETVDLSGINADVRRIEFGGNPSTSFAIDYLRFDYVVDRTNVPEPAALSLVALALAGLGLSRRRKA